MPRLNEILNVAKNIKTPSVTINIRKADDEEEASDLISQVRPSAVNLFYFTLSLSITPLPLAFINLYFALKSFLISSLTLILSPTPTLRLTFLPLIYWLQIEYTTLGDITVKTEIHYDPDASTTVIEEDKEFVDEYLLLEGT